MANEAKPLGILKPLGGGDPIPLRKDEMIIGRRPKCDIRLDFENVSGKHCALNFEKGIWKIRDLGSTNGTTVNGAKLVGDRGLMPDDEVGIANHFFSLDYEPVGSIMLTKSLLEEEFSEPKRRRSFLEMAGLEDPNRDRPASRGRRAPEPAEAASERMDTTPDEAPAIIERAEPPASDPSSVSDSEYFKFFQEDLDKG